MVKLIKFIKNIEVINQDEYLDKVFDHAICSSLRHRCDQRKHYSHHILCLTYPYFDKNYIL